MTRMSQEVPGSWTFTVINVGITFRCMQAQLANQGEFFASYVSKNFIPGRVSVGGRFEIIGPSAHEALRVRSAIGRPVNRIFCMFMRLLVRRLHVPRILTASPIDIIGKRVLQHVITLQWKAILLRVTGKDNNWGIDRFRSQGYCHLEDLNI